MFSLLLAALRFGRGRLKKIFLFWSPPPFRRFPVSLFSPRGIFTEKYRVNLPPSYEIIREKKKPTSSKRGQLGWKALTNSTSIDPGDGLMCCLDTLALRDRPGQGKRISKLSKQLWRTFSNKTGLSLSMFARNSTFSKFLVLICCKFCVNSFLKLFNSNHAWGRIENSSCIFVLTEHNFLRTNCAKRKCAWMKLFWKNDSEVRYSVWDCPKPSMKRAVSPSFSRISSICSFEPISLECHHWKTPACFWRCRDFRKGFIRVCLFQPFFCT